MVAGGGNGVRKVGKGVNAREVIFQVAVVNEGLEGT